MFKTLSIALVACFVTFGAHAQKSTAQNSVANTNVYLALIAKPVVVPPQFKAIFDGYRGWTTEYPQIEYSNSISNWAYKTKREFSSVIIAAARNWLFMQTEERFTSLVNANASDIKALFGDVYLASGVHIVFSTPFTKEINERYRKWYACMGQTKWGNYTGATLIEDRVLTQINNRDPLDGIEHECTTELKVLSLQYGVEVLSTEDIHAIGFLSRRHLANVANSKFLSAEFIRKTIGELFDPNS